MHVVIDRKLTNGCKIQNACCDQSQTMMQLKLVKSAKEEHTHQDDHPDSMLHGTKVLLYLVKPWFHANHIAVGDSYFLSLGATYMVDKMEWVSLVLSRQQQRNFQ